VRIRAPGALPLNAGVLRTPTGGMTFAASILFLTASAATTFPGDQSEVRAPSGRFAVAWVAADESPNGEHQLLLKDNRSGTSTLLLSFGRSVTVAWSPDGQHLAISNRVGSDSTESWVYSVDGTPPVSVWTLLKLQHGERSLAFATGAHHLYVEADAWLSNSALSIRAWGYGGAQPFDRRFRVTLSR